MKSPFILITLILMISLASASTYNIEFTQIGSKIVVKQDLSFEQETNISIEIPKDASSISANTNYTLENNNIILKGKDIEFSFISQEVLSKSKEYYFVYKIVSPEFFDDLNATFILDEGFVVDKKDIFPQGETSTDGINIIVKWNFKNIDKNEIKPLFIKFKDTNENNTLLIIIVLIVAILFYFSLRIRKEKKEDKKENIKANKKEEKEDKYLEYLAEPEQIIMKELKNLGTTWQKQLQIATGFSKAKLSRTIRNLEAKNLIEKIPFGNTNKIKSKK